jgi:hypothetical protein
MQFEAVVESIHVRGMGFSRDLRILVFAGIGGTLVDFRSKKKPNGFSYLGHQ